MAAVMPSVKTVAAHAGVSAQTVSRVLRGIGYVSSDTRAKVLAAVDAVGYQPNAMGRALRATRTQMIGLVVSDVTNPFYARLHKALEGIFRANGLSLMLLNSDDDAVMEQRQLDLINSYRPSGLLISPAARSKITTQQLHSLGNCVLVSRVLDDVNVPAVVTNESEAMAEATRVLLEAGHRKIVAVLGFEHTSTASRRAAGYREAVEAAGCQALIYYTDQTGPDARRAMTDALDAHPDATGVVTFNEPVTLGVIAAMHDRGISCPNDISLVGFTDASWMEFFQPPITVVRQPVEEMGVQAAKLLIGLLSGCQPVEQTVVVRSELLHRMSVAPSRDVFHRNED